MLARTDFGPCVSSVGPVAGGLSGGGGESAFAARCARVERAAAGGRDAAVAVACRGDGGDAHGLEPPHGRRGDVRARRARRRRRRRVRDPLHRGRRRAARGRHARAVRRGGRPGDADGAPADRHARGYRVHDDGGPGVPRTPGAEAVCLVGRLDGPRGGGGGARRRGRDGRARQRIGPAGGGRLGRPRSARRYGAFDVSVVFDGEAALSARLVRPNLGTLLFIR